MKKILFGVVISMFIGINTSYASITADFNLDNPEADMTVTPGSGKCGDNVNWSLSQDGTLTISGSGKMYNYEEFGSAPWFENNASKAILNVEVENGVESICQAAFYDTSIVSLVLPDSIKEISFASITHCNNLQYLVLSDNIESLPENSVSYNDSLTYIHMPQKLKSIGNNAFLEDIKLEQIIIPSGVTQIGDRAFSKCITLKKVVIPPKMTSIGDGAFSQCVGMEELYLPPSIENINQYAFTGCVNIDKIILPDGINEIPTCVFTADDEVRRSTEPQIIYVPESVSTFGIWAILGDNIEIHGFADSEAEKYAKENEIPFVAVTESMYSEEEYNSVLNGQIETAPEMPVQMLTPQNILDVIDLNGNLTIKLDGEIVSFSDAQPFIDENGRTQIPIRAVAEMLGCKVDWNDRTRTATLTKDDTVVVITIDNAAMQVDTETVTMDTTAQIINDRTYIPLRFAGEALGITVNWKSE